MTNALLSELVAQHLGEAPRVPFRAMNGKAVTVTAVLERTAVVHDGDICAKRLVRLDQLSVDPGGMDWLPSVGVYEMGGIMVSAASAARGRKIAAAAVQRERGRYRTKGKATLGQRRFNGSHEGQVFEADLLRIQGKKRCPDCSKVKEFAAFSADGYCQSCSIERRRQARAKKAAVGA
jgi:hypothetical protein